MAKRIEESILNFYDSLLSAAKIGTSRSDDLRKADTELEKMKHYLRLSLDLKLINLKQYEYSSREIVEIGKLLGGWIRKSA